MRRFWRPISRWFQRVRNAQRVEETDYKRAKRLRDPWVFMDMTNRTK